MRKVAYRISTEANRAVYAPFLIQSTRVRVLLEFIFKVAMQEEVKAQSFPDIQLTTHHLLKTMATMAHP